MLNWGADPETSSASCKFDDTIVEEARKIIYIAGAWMK
jgi:hypothetical protein